MPGLFTITEAQKAVFLAGICAVGLFVTFAT